ncbi:MAG: hypothetical protein K5696_08940 [Lachnospiraceae bacterium]|nr:hypothetical protein [Lachnospiraceae bacterium]
MDTLAEVAEVSVNMGQEIGMICFEDRILKNRLRRNRELKRRLTNGIAALSAMLFILLFGLSSAMTSAKEAGVPTGVKYYRCITVLPRDTVENAASNYLTADERQGIEDREAYAAEIRAINHLSPDEQPLAGTKLIIPYYAEEASN